SNWESIIRTTVITILAYIALIFLLRGFGKRTLSKMNAFDFIVTIALGSCLASVALNKNVVLLDGILAFFLLIFMQFSISWLSVMTKFVKNFDTRKASMLRYKGEIIEKELKKQRITLEDLHMAVRKKGHTDLKNIDVIVIEATGEITVISEAGEKEEGLEFVENKA